jgi:ubiquinone/menaquinone biosynthesis C-methylase UbiE
MSSIATAYDEWAKSYDSDSNKTRDLEAIAFDQKVLGTRRAVVLELGCGTGKNTVKLAHLASEKLIAMDFSPEMMRAAEARLANSSNVAISFVLRDLVSTEWSEVEAGSVDLITESLVLEHASHEQLCFVAAQCARALRPGGVVYLGEFHPMRQYNGAQATNRAIGNDGGRIKAFVHHLTDFLNAFKAAGLKLIDIDEFFDAQVTNESASVDECLVARGLPRILTLMFEKTA